MSEKIYGQFELETIEKLADIINTKQLSEIKIVDGDKEITIKGKPAVPHGAPVPLLPPMGLPPVPVMGQNAAQETAAPQVSAKAGKEVKAPIVGTFYAAPSPDSKPFVSVGDTVKKGDTIFIIESMKVMSEVQSEFDGVVREICVANGEPVEFDQTIMILD